MAWLIPSALQDAERLAGEAGDETLVELWAKWREVEGRRVPEGLTIEEGERFTEGLAEQGDALAIQIMTAPAQTVLGAYAQIAVLGDWAENGVPVRAEAALKVWHGSIEAALHGAATAGD